MINAAPVKWKKISAPDSRELTTDPRVQAKVVELPREDHQPTAMTLVPLPILIAEMVIASKRKEIKVAEDQDQTA